MKNQNICKVRVKSAKNDLFHSPPIRVQHFGFVEIIWFSDRLISHILIIWSFFRVLRRCWYPVDGQQWRRHQREPVLPDAGTNSVARWKAHDIRPSFPWHPSSCSNRPRGDRPWRPACGRRQNTKSICADEHCHSFIAFAVASVDCHSLMLIHCVSLTVSRVWAANIVRRPWSD